ncbi:MAG: anti-sigma factor [Ginsengibacter sp.]
MNSNDIISSGFLELYAMGLSSPEETVQVESWIAEYPEVKKELQEVEMSLESYALAHAIEPSGLVKEKIFSQINADGKKANLSFIKTGAARAEPVIYRIPSYFKLIAAAMLVLLIGSAILNYSYYNKYQSTNSDLQIAQQKIAQQDSVNLAMNKDMDVITDKNSVPVVLNGTPHAPEALAKIFWMKNTGEVYIDPSNLPAIPAGKQYQLWAIVDGKPVSGGMISTEKGIYHIQKMKSFGKAEAFAITLEKAGGSPTPTMDEMYVISKI